MKRLFTLTLTAAWTLAIAAPPAISATEMMSVPPAEECSVENSMTGENSMTCGGTRTVTTVTVNSDGDIIVTQQTCEFEGVGYDPLPGGGGNPYCEYGNCGKVYLTPA